MIYFYLLIFTLYALPCEIIQISHSFKLKHPLLVLGFQYFELQILTNKFQIKLEFKHSVNLFSPNLNIVQPYFNLIHECAHVCVMMS